MKLISCLNSLWLTVIVPIIPFDKFVDAMDLKNDLICIFMNINENDENQDLLYYHLNSLSGYRMYLAHLEQMLMGASLFRGSL